MTEIKTILYVLCERIRNETGKNVILLDTEPASIDETTIYVLSPGSDDVSCTHFIGSGSLLEYEVRIYEITHSANANRQISIDENVYASYNESDSVLRKCFSRARHWKQIVTANIYEYTFGTATWVVNSKVYSAYQLTLSIKDILED